MNARRVAGVVDQGASGTQTPADLERTFSEAGEGDDTPSSVARYLRQRRGEKQDWPWLLKSALVVILNEAGAGKTWEIRRQVQRKTAAREDAFFLPLERLARHEGDLLFETPEQAHNFRRWRSSRRTATFFLDALDEAKLPSSADAHPLHIALRRLEAMIGDRAWGRVRLVIASRPSAFKQAEEVEVSRLADKLRSRGTDGPCPHVVKLDPLSLDQQVLLGRHLAAPDEFVAKLHDQDAIDLAPTPLDFENLLDAYRAEEAAGRRGEAIFNSLSAVVDRAIAWRIEGHPTSRPRSRLSPQRTREGARRLACACLLGPSLVIRTPGTHGHGVEAMAVLNGGGGGWSIDDVDQLLASGLFTPAWDGRVHFHHRRTLDRLAAEAFDDLLSKGLGLQEVADILTPAAYGQTSAPAAFHGALGWLATLNPGFRNHLVGIAPQLLIEEGDPSRLPLSVREQVLVNHVARYGDIRWRHEWMDGARARRFVEPSLAPTISRLLLGPIIAEEPAGHLIALAEMGGLSACADALLDVAQDQLRTPSLRARAIHALVLLGESSHLETIKAITLRLRWSNDDPDHHTRHERNQLRIAGVIACARLSTAREMLGMVTRLDRRSEQYTNLGDHGLAEAIALACSIEELPRLLRWLSRLCWMRRDLPITYTAPLDWTHLGWHLLPALHAVAVRCVRERPPGLDVAFLALETERLLNVADVMLSPLWRYDRETPDPLTHALHEAAWLRQAIFLQWLAEHDPPKAGDAAMHLDRRARPFQQLDEDLHWLLDGYRQIGAGALSDAYGRAIVDRLWRTSPKGRAHWWRDFCRLAAAKGDQESLRRLPTWFRRWGGVLELKARRAWMTSRVRKYLRHPEWLRRDFLLASSKRRLKRAGRALGDLRHEGLAFWAVRRHLYSKDPLSNVRAEHGDAVAEGVLFAAKGFALRFVPSSPIGRATEALQFATLGWSMIAQDDPAAIDSVTDDHARVALIAGLAQNPVPGWAKQIAGQRVALWKSLIEPEIAEDIARLKTRRGGALGLLATLARLSTVLQRPFAGEVAALIAGPNALTIHQLDDVFAVARSDPENHSLLMATARHRTREYLASGEIGVAAAWLREWMWFDSTAAWAEVQRFRDHLWGDEDPMVLVFEGLAERLSLNHLGPAVAAAFARDVYRHLGDDDDEARSSEVTSRSRALRYKRDILPFLAQDPSPEARAALAGLLADPLFETSRGWIHRLLAEQAAEAARPRDWTASEVAALLDVWLRPPNSIDALFEMAERQLVSIAGELRTSEFDIRGLFRSAMETEVRAFFGDALRRRSQQWFDVTQESVTSGEKRTDLRLAAEFGVVVVELKLADRTSASELRERLENQLLGQYLISRKVRHGIFAVIRAAGTRRSWPLPCGVDADFPGLVAWLSSEAATLAGGADGVGRLKVVGLDIASPKPAQKRRRSSPPLDS